MAKSPIATDAEVEAEIADLKASPEVKLARKEDRLRNARKKQLYYYRCMAKRGADLMAQGITDANIKSRLFPNV